MTTSKPETATVETLTAAVHALMIGNRQITLSIAKQLDELEIRDDYQPDDFVPFGRMRTGIKMAGEDWWTGKPIQINPKHEFIGSNRRGELVRVAMSHSDYDYLENAEVKALVDHWAESLPLIVLAGLR